MQGESVDTRLARLEEAMVSVKGDTVYLRRGFDGFKEKYWVELSKTAGRMGSISAVTSLIVGFITAAIMHAVFK